MVSKSSAVRSIRLQNDLWAWLAEEAERRGVAVNALVSDLVLAARDPPERPIVAEHPKVVKAAPTATVPGKMTLPKAAYGARLKGSKK